jgi:uncharacterized protein YqgC (DUF456 family)
MVVLYWCLVALMIVGVIGSFIPAIPGPSLIVIGIVIWGLVHGFEGLGIPLVVSVLVLLASIGLEFLATYLGAKHAGASKWGQIGAIVGLVIGFFGLLPALPFGGPLLGLLLGPLLGAIVGEYLYRRNLKLAARAGIGIIVGSLIGIFVEGLLAIAALVVFLLSTWSQGMGA